MKELIIYQFEVSVCMLVFSVLYFLLWKRETNFQVKRLLLFGIPVLAFLIPCLDFSINLAMDKPSEAIQYLSYLPSQFIAPVMTSAVAGPSVERFTMWQVLFLIWISGVSFMAIRLLVSYYKIWRIYCKSEKIKGSAYRLVDEPIQSFSFFNFVVINRCHADSNAKEYILAHELAHSQQFHSLDVILFETLKIVQWFNPLLWLLINESKKNLEYLADQEASTITKNIQGYQYAIVRHATTTSYQLLRSEFSKSNLKNRIIMMNKPNNRKIHALKLLLIIPVLGMLLMSFSLKIENLDLKKEFSEILPVLQKAGLKSGEFVNLQSNEKIQIEYPNAVYPYSILSKKDTSRNEVFIIVEDQPTPSTGDIDSYYQAIYKELNYPEEEKQNDIKGKVFVQFIVQKDGTLSEVKVVKGISTACDAEAVRVIEEGPKWIAGKQRGQGVNVRMNLAIAFGEVEKTELKKIEGTIKTEGGEPVIACYIRIKGTQISTFSDGEGRFRIEVEPEHKELIFDYVGLEPRVVEISDVKNFSIILKDDENKAAIPKLNYNGQVIGHSVPAASLDGSHSIRIGRAIADPASDSTSSTSQFRAVRGLAIADDEKQPLYILDGEEITREDMELIQSDDIESISVLKDASATTKYGEKGENGVIIIKTKEGVIIQPTTKFDIDTDNPPIFIKDGVEITQEEVEKLYPEDIERIDVLKGESATKKYGQKAENGVIIITLKK